MLKNNYKYYAQIFGSVINTVYLCPIIHTKKCDKMEHPTKKGQRITTELSSTRVFTVAGFYGSDGIPHDTIEQARVEQPDGIIIVWLKETNGSVELEKCSVCE